MIWVDNAIISLLAIYTVSGLLRGVHREMFYMMVWIIGIIVAWCFATDFTVFLVKPFQSPVTRLAASFISLIVITLTIGWLVNLLLTAAFSPARLTFMDRLSGMIFGALHGCLVAFTLVLLAGITSLPKESWWHQSRYIPTYQSLAVMMKETVPSRLAESITYPKPLKEN